MTRELEPEVLQQVERLGRGDLGAIESAVAAKRRAWLAERRPDGGWPKPSPREAFELLFSTYMGLDLTELPVVKETAEEIVWRSENTCPTLEACKRLDLDTREVCRRAYEKPTQAFLSVLDPELRFHRSYETIRPHGPHCEERIVRVDFAALMALAVNEARRSRAEGNKGYGAVVVHGGEVIATAHDTAATERDPSAHAEVNAIRKAVERLGDPNLCGAVLLSSCEPCPMCSSLAVWANVTTIVYGASIEETVALGKARIRLSAGEVVERSPAHVEVIGGVLRQQCLELYR